MDIVFIDTEVSTETNKVCDYGAITSAGEKLHTNSEREFTGFISGHEYVCGHNIIAHDLKYIPAGAVPARVIDTLCLSPLMFPERPYHSLLKDDKLSTDELNNPLNDSIKAMELFYSEINAFENMSERLRGIFCGLLYNTEEFRGFFDYAGYTPHGDITSLIRKEFSGRICENADIRSLAAERPVELAYCLSLISCGDKYSVLPRWVHMNYPAVEKVMRQLRSVPCREGCGYCAAALDIRARLKGIFGYDGFREYDGEPLQEKAVRAAVRGESLLAVFPTGGGKSVTFQLPALMAGEAAGELTVVISPLQSLMKDQVDNLVKKGITDAVTINGLLSPIERMEAIDRVESGLASILYISPESLRSRTIERLFMSRSIARFVIDEAHCFSAWGQDFRVDYLYIGDFIKELSEKKQLERPIPVSCFTATAKLRVISDIREYFMQKTGTELTVYSTEAARTNLRYEVLYKNSEGEKYAAMRELIASRDCPVIVYVSRTKKTRELARKLCEDGFSARAFNGRMDSAEKQKNQEAFINDEVRIIVATSAFGMGVDKPDVGLVIHYDISDSLENYVQEAGRAGRDSSLNADCYVLYGSGDLDKHFMMLNRSKVSISEIQQVWRAIKDMTGHRRRCCRSALEIARRAGWDDSASDVETRVRTAVLALENANYIKRGKNVPHVYANSILVRNMAEASAAIEGSDRFDENGKVLAKRIISSLITSRSMSAAGNDDGESRIDYMSDRLGAEKSEVIRCIELLREEGILSDSKDLTAYIRRSDSANKSLAVLKKYIALERYLLTRLENGEQSFYLKELNEFAAASGITSSVNSIRTVFYYLTIKNFIEKSSDAASGRITVTLRTDAETLRRRRENCMDAAETIVNYLYEKSLGEMTEKDEALVMFSVLELRDEYNLTHLTAIDSVDIEDALLYLSKIDSMRLEGGFLVLYSGMELQRTAGGKTKYKKEDYKQLEEYYRQKMLQIHIVGEYAEMMARGNSGEAQRFVSDYFHKEHGEFLHKYFSGERLAEIERNITPAKHKALFGDLSERQLEIIGDKSRYIVVAAGPGSGKTRVLVRKLASLMQLEDVKHEQLLMLTFSRAAATEFRTRLRELMGNAASFVEIKTFHSYCFDIIGRTGNLEQAGDIVAEAAQMIRNGEAEQGRITKTVVVIDEAQDMDEHEYDLICALMERNDDMRVIAVGDDDQNIYKFRGSDPKYMASFITEKGAVKYELTENYRSCAGIVSLANAFAETISSRMKTSPVTAVKSEDGDVKLVSHSSRYLTEAVVKDVMASSGEGTVCVLTNTNLEAVNTAGLLNKLGRRAKLIQANDSFDIYNIAEIRYFIRQIEAGLTTPVIDDDRWERAKARMSETYADSECLELCLALLDDYESSAGRKYKTDLEDFLHESKLESFCRAEKGTVLVSTIHKSKGREFDSVYMLLDGVTANTDEEKRKLYVGMTRAASRLHIHYNGGLLDGISAEGVQWEQDSAQYEAPAELILQLTHRDVFLDFFKGRKKFILRHIKSGAELLMTERGLGARSVGGIFELLRFSKDFRTRMESLAAMGYTPFKGKARFVVAWTYDDNSPESAVILPDLYFRRTETE